MSEINSFCLKKTKQTRILYKNEKRYYFINVNMLKNNIREMCTKEGEINVNYN